MDNKKYMVHHLEVGQKWVGNIDWNSFVGFNWIENYF